MRVIIYTTSGVTVREHDCIGLDSRWARKMVFEARYGGDDEEFSLNDIVKIEIIP